MFLVCFHLLRFILALIRLHLIYNETLASSFLAIHTPTLTPLGRPNAHIRTYFLLPYCNSYSSERNLYFFSFSLPVFNGTLVYFRVPYFRM